MSGEVRVERLRGEVHRPTFQWRRRLEIQTRATKTVPGKLIAWGHVKMPQLHRFFVCINTSTSHKIKSTVPPTQLTLALAALTLASFASAQNADDSDTGGDGSRSAASHTYHEPYPLPLLILLSFLFLLPIAGHVAQRLLCAGLLGQILLGVIFGTPVGGWLDETWEEAWVALGYVGLLGLVFEGELHGEAARRTGVGGGAVVGLRGRKKEPTTVYREWHTSHIHRREGSITYDTLTGPISRASVALPTLTPQAA
jgi:hypothetical protein